MIIISSMFVTSFFILIISGLSINTTFSNRGKQQKFQSHIISDKGTIDAKHSVQTNQNLIVVGESKWSVSMEIYDFQKQQWSQGPESFSRPWRDEIYLFNAGKKVYMVSSWFDDFTTVDVFKTITGKWSALGNLHEGRWYARAAVLDGDIYISGGVDTKAKVLKSCEKFDQETNSWIKIADMLQERSIHAMCAMDGKIYAVGGSNIKGNLATVECYSPEMDTWTQIPAMSSERPNAGVAALDGKLYVVGGGDERVSLARVDVFDSINQKWTRLADLNVARTSPGVTAANGKIYVAGGFVYTKYIDSVEIYDPLAGNWTMLPNNMLEGKKCASAAFIDWPASKGS